MLLYRVRQLFLDDFKPPRECSIIVFEFFTFQTKYSLASADVNQAAAWEDQSGDNMTWLIHAGDNWWLKKSLQEVWEKKIWLSSSPYCNPLDYIKGSWLSYISVELLTTAWPLWWWRSPRVMASPNRDTVARACVQTQETGSGDCWWRFHSITSYLTYVSLFFWQW